MQISAKKLIKRSVKMYMELESWEYNNEKTTNKSSQFW